MKAVAPKKKINGFSPALFQLMDVGYFDTGCSDVVPRVLHDIYVNNGCTAASITKRVRISKSYVSRVINEYEKEGYIRREESADDGRILQLYLTDKGVTYIESYMSSASTSVAKKIDALNEIDRQKLMEAFNTIMNILKQ